MAIFHFRIGVISRNKGQNVVAKAAYNSRESLINENTGRRHSYRSKGHCLYREILLPADAPEWLGKLAESRQSFWSCVEATEKRKDSQLAREVVIALPHELTDQQMQGLAVAFVRETFTADGMVADLAIHPPPQDGDCRNYHAHILLTMRVIGEKQFKKKIAVGTAKQNFNIGGHSTS